ncbi:MAG: AzlD domain-containing protein [Treponema sp.]|jgi:branched-subunit amino acid transport protein AzlD|nr:AzlD domain-containing protein [Treponema sp.]
MLPPDKAVIYIFVMSAVIFFCRVFPFIFFRGAGDNDKHENKLLLFVEKTAPPLAMTALCFNAIAAPIKDNIAAAPPIIAASTLTALLHIWKRNALLSIFSGTAVFMLLERL